MYGLSSIFYLLFFSPPHFFLFLLIFLIRFITFFFKITALRGLCLLIIGFKLYAITIYYYFQFNGPLKTPNVPGFLAADGPYLLGLFLVISRLLFSSDPFGKASQKQKLN